MKFASVGGVESLAEVIRSYVDEAARHARAGIDTVVPRILDGTGLRDR